MKKRLLLCLVLSLFTALMLTGCGSSKDESKYAFDFDKDQMVQFAESVVNQYNAVSDSEADYYLNDGTNLEKNAVSGFKAAQTTDHVGTFLNYFDTSGKNLKFKNGARDNVLCSFIAKYENRDVRVTVSFVQNREYSMDLEKYKKEIEEEAANKSYTDVDKYIQDNYSSYGIDVSSEDAFVKSFASTQQVYPFKADDCEVSAVYSMQELLKRAGGHTAIGMGTVFVILIFISFIIALLKFIPKLLGMEKNEQKEKTEPDKIKNKETNKAALKTVKKINKTPVSEKDEIDNSELAAVITAAIYAAEAANGNTFTDSKDKLVVRSIRRVR